MSKYRFVGTLKEIVLNDGKVTLGFVPDAECSSIHKESKKKNVAQKFAILQPIGTYTGRVYAYKDSIAFEVECKGGVRMSIGRHCEMMLEDDGRAVRKGSACVKKLNGSKIADMYYLVDVKER